MLEEKGGGGNASHISVGEDSCKNVWQECGDPDAGGLEGSR